ncbi:nucleotide pyrophosphohydrolase [Streptomyces sp. NPDC002215]|uniref:nucleotide pyrophosphohydrolase n=1 Tax=Streptomyces sp. NPDC002215 TaxID=3154412 RepID=UPI003318BA87
MGYFLEVSVDVRLGELEERALVVKRLYDERNRLVGREWTREEFMLGFVGDVGDLAKLAAAAEGARRIPGWRPALEHELSDCLWSVLVLAHLHDVDLATAFFRTMSELEKHVEAGIERARSAEGTT